MVSEPFLPDSYWVVRHVVGVILSRDMFHDSKLVPEEIC